MSIHWTKDHVGYDGDVMYGHVAVNYWQPRGTFIAQVEQQIEAIRADILTERDRLMADIDEET